MKFITVSRKLGRKIQELRKAKGLKQEDMENFGIPYKYYERIESPGTHPVNMTLKTLMKIADALDAELSDFFEFYEDEGK